MKKIKRILMFCLGNTARSPVAEYLARYYTKELGADLIIESAGFMNAFSSIQPTSQRYLDSKGINYSDFKPQLITRKLLENQDLILTMESSHSAEIIQNYSNIKDIPKKTFTLKEFNEKTEDLDIIDPYYASSKTYEKVLIVIDQNIKMAINKIIKLNKQ